MRSIHRTVKGRVVEVDEVDRNGRLLLFSRVVVAAKRLSRLVSMRKIPY
jgi:leucyl aminopeptidase